MSEERKAGAPRSRQAPRPATVVDALRLDGAAARAPSGEFSYSITVPVAAPKRPAPPEPPARAASDKRGTARQRTRLRTGKVIDGAGRFICECLVSDRSDTGSRLRLPAGVTMTMDAFQYYDDQRGTLQQVDVVWRLDGEIGIRFRAAAASARTRALEAEMRRRFYVASK